MLAGKVGTKHSLEVFGLYGEVLSLAVCPRPKCISAFLKFFTKDELRWSSRNERKSCRTRSRPNNGSR